NTAFTENTYSHTTIGFWEDVVDMPNQYEYSLQFFDRWYRPEYCTIIVVGDVTQENVDALAKEYFGEWEHGSYTQEVPVEPEQTETRYAHVQEQNFPPILSLNYKGPSFSVNDLDMAALDVISTLAFSERSSIYKELVQEKRIVRQLSAGGLNTVDPNLWSVDAVLVNKEDLTLVKNEIMKVLEDLKTKPVDSAALAETKSNLKYSFAMNLDNPDDIANNLAHFTYVTGDPANINPAYANYEKVTPEVIMEVANRFLINNHLTVATISPDDKVEVIEDLNLDR
ncbi:unnamed protein product, partial [Chrysoparadoxa australica]